MQSKPTKLAKAVVLAAVMLCIVATPRIASAQTPDATPTPATTPTPAPEQEAPPASAAPQTEGGFDMSKLTPEQQEALRLAIVKLSQNPVGNITVVPFQNNFNYGVGPYTRFQYNLNIQPVFPIMLSKDWSLISRTIFPLVDQPSFAPRPYARRRSVVVRPSGSATRKSSCTSDPKPSRTR